MDNKNVSDVPGADDPWFNSSKEKWRQERRAFHALFPSLLQTHREKYVAIYQGQVVDSGDDLIEVATRAYERFGYVPIYVDLVSEKPQKPVRLPSIRRIRPEMLP